jgi:hypothetical protein
MPIETKAGLPAPELIDRLEEQETESWLEAEYVPSAWAEANRLHDKMVDDLLSVAELAEQILAGESESSEPSSEPQEETKTKAEYVWYRHVETNSAGRESFCWKFTYDTSFKHFREAAGNDRAFTLELSDLSEPEFVYAITAGEFSDLLKNRKLKLIIPAVRGAVQRRAELRAEHPKWLIEFGRQTSGSNTPFIQIPVECVRKQRRPPVEELLNESD